MPESKKMVIKVDIHDDNDQRKALKAVSGLLGIESLSVEMKDGKVTVFGDVDPVDVVGKLRKWRAEIVTVGPAKEPEKKEDDAKKKKEQEEQEAAMRRCIEAQRAYNPCMCMTHRYCVHPVEEDPRVCVIC